MRRKIGDRRGRPRFDIVGELSGGLEMSTFVPVSNLGPGGALIESHLRLPEGSTHRLTMRTDDQSCTIDVRVRHVRPHVGEDGESRFLIGVEFLTPHHALLAQLTEWTVADEDAAGT